MSCYTVLRPVQPVTIDSGSRSAIGVESGDGRQEGCSRRAGEWKSTVEPPIWGGS